MVKYQKGFSAVWLILFAIIIASLGLYLFSKSKNDLFPNITPRLPSKEDVLIEKIPGSKFHSPDATWWGYNQSKIVRFKDLVFTYVIENGDDSNKTPSNFTVYVKDDNKSWRKGASFVTSRPGNILVDSQGTLHAFVFEPFDIEKNDSWGKLKHYYFPSSARGDISTFSEELIVDNDGSSETANIRVGAAIGEDDTLAVGFGLTKFNPVYKGQSEHLYFKKRGGQNWTHLIAGENLVHDYYYPFVLAGKKGFHLLPVQDDYNDDGSPATYDNVYQKIIYFVYQNEVWKSQMIQDLSTHPLARARPRLLEQEDLYEDKEGKIHILYKEFLDAQETWKVTSHKHVIITGGEKEEQTINLGKDDVNWIRLFEVDGGLYYLISSWNSLYISKVGTNKLEKIEIPEDAKGFYPYVASKKGSTKNDEKYVDILLLAADNKTYSEGTNSNYYIRIPKERL